MLLRRPEGSLLKEFEALAPVWLWKEDFDFSSLQSRERFDVLYSNTITNGAVLEDLAGFRLPVITHVHELEFWIRHRMDQVTLQHTLQHTTSFVAASWACERVLTETLGVAKDRVRVISEFVDTEEFCRTARADKVREGLAIPPEAFVIGACGTTDWRKGPDLFIQLAALIRKRCAVPPVHFLWVGGDNHGAEHAALWHDVRRCGLTECVHFVGAVDDPARYFFEMDALALLSREDTFPIVMLEAAALQKPSCVSREREAPKSSCRPRPASSCRTWTFLRSPKPSCL